MLKATLVATTAVTLALAAAALSAIDPTPPSLWPDGSGLGRAFAHEVDRRLAPPAAAQQHYAAHLEAALAQARSAVGSEYVVLVDRNPNVQAVFIYWGDSAGRWHFVGASPASTGRRGGFEHFLTPLGVYEHSTANPDFRAEGTRNAFGVRGYGVKGMRVYDFGWVQGERTWGDGGTSLMRLQMHATDPTLLEPSLGSARSKGCIRIPASLNRLIDRYGILDADYERGLARGERYGVLSPSRTPTPWSGRYLVVIESDSSQRPDWSPRPSGAVATADAAQASPC